jgi:hypothetical protein
MGKSWLSSVAWSTLLLTGCTQIGPYHTTISATVSGQPTEIDSQHLLRQQNKGQDNEFRLGFVEFDEYGHLFNRKQLVDVMAQLGALEEQNPIILVFVHGWHHNAAENDENLLEFKKVLADASATEKHLSEGKNPRRPVIGLFVGWRGESVKSPSYFPYNILTFWERKNVAQAIGHGGMVELFSLLAEMHDRHSEHSRLIIIGHSFGGALVYSALAQVMIDRMSRLPAVEPQAEPKRVRPLGNLIVLLNPAFEAMLYRPLFDLARSREYNPQQMPVMATITTENDWATHYAFKAGRLVSTLFDSYADPPVGGAMNTSAIGHYLPFVTHVLLPVKNCEPADHTKDSKTENLQAAITRHLVNFQDSSQDRKCFNLKGPSHENDPELVLIRNDRPESGGELTKGNYIEKGLVSNGRAPYHNPFLTIRTTKEVIDGHNGIWNDTLRSFLRQFILLSLEHPGLMPTFRTPGTP